MLKTVVALVMGYLFGNFSTGILVGKANHVDLRSQGSGNIGATNALRTLGWLHGGIPTFLGDFFKCVIPVLLMKYVIAKDLPGTPSGLFSTEWYCLATGFGAVLGHNFPFLQHFKGGKGVATSLGTLVAMNPLLSIPVIVTFIVVVKISKYVSLASLSGMVLSPILVQLYYHKPALTGITLCFTILSFIRHRENIVRLMNGTENKMGKKKS